MYIWRPSFNEPHYSKLHKNMKCHTIWMTKLMLYIDLHALPKQRIKFQITISVSEGFSNHSVQLLNLWGNGRGETLCEILHFYCSWLMCQCYSWIRVLLSRVSEQSHGCHPGKTTEYVSRVPVQKMQKQYQQEKKKKISVSLYLSECISSVTTGSLSFFSKSHMWSLEAASSTQKTAGLVRDHCSETTGSPDPVKLFHSATGCSWLTTCSRMLPSPHPTWKISEKGFQGTIYRLLLIHISFFWLCILLFVLILMILSLFE